jgi:hypothetical protein
LILVAFLLPFSIYLFVVGTINRRRRPLLVSGVTDFIGLLFAASGFLLFGGPAVLTSLSDRWRMFWLVGQRPASGSTDSLWLFWLIMSVLYFVVVVGGSALILRGRRSQTALYNIDQEMADRCIVHVCEQLGLDPVRSGNLYVFGVEPAVTSARKEGEGVQTAPGVPRQTTAAALAFATRSAVLEVDAYSAMRHVTLRWDPRDAPMRKEVEAGLERLFAETSVEPSDFGAWLTILGVGLFGLAVLGTLAILLIRAFV